MVPFMQEARNCHFSKDHKSSSKRPAPPPFTHRLPKSPTAAASAPHPIVFLPVPPAVRLTPPVQQLRRGDPASHPPARKLHGTGGLFRAPRERRQGPSPPTPQAVKFPAPIVCPGPWEHAPHTCGPPGRFPPEGRPAAYPPSTRTGPREFGQAPPPGRPDTARGGGRSPSAAGLSRLPLRRPPLTGDRPLRLVLRRPPPRLPVVPAAPTCEPHAGPAWGGRGGGGGEEGGRAGFTPAAAPPSRRPRAQPLCPAPPPGASASVAAPSRRYRGSQRARAPRPSPPLSGGGGGGADGDGEGVRRRLRTTQEKFAAFKMSSVKRLVYAVIHFLREQSQMDTFTPDEQESLEVAIQCLETVFKINLEDTHLAPPQHLIEMFTNSFHKNDMLPLSDTLPEDVEKADQLKDEGNNYMKEENYGAAVDCYTRAIKLDPNNAVYYCNRAAAQSKLNKYSEAIKDCERAIAIDPKYSKAYGRMGLALTSVNKYEEAVTSYQKALDLDPENDSYKSNLKIAEQKLRDMSSPTGTGLSFDMASLINNPAFISMAASLMQNPQVQQLMSGMMSNAIGGPAAGVGGLSDLSSLIHAGQQFAQQIQQQNPELIEQLRNHVRSRSFSGSTEEHS